MIADARMKRLASWAGHEIWMRPAPEERWIWIVRSVAQGLTVGGVAESYESAKRAAYPALAMAVRGDDVHSERDRPPAQGAGSCPTASERAVP